MAIGRFRLGLIVGLSVGYVAGTASGRERYDQMESAARRVVSAGRRAASSKLARGAGRRLGVGLGGGSDGLGDTSGPAPGTDGVEAGPGEPLTYRADRPPRSSF